MIAQVVLVRGDIQDVDVGRGVDAVGIDVQDAGLLRLLDQGIHACGRNRVYQNDVVPLVDAVLDLLCFGGGVPVRDKACVGYIEPVGGRGSSRGTGGMITKLDAAQIARDAHIPTAILNGEDPENIYRLLDGESVGTVFGV